MVLRRFKVRRKQLIILLDKKAITEQGILYRYLSGIDWLQLLDFGHYLER